MAQGKRLHADSMKPFLFKALGFFEIASSVVSHKNVTKVVGCQLGSLNDSMSMVSGVRCQVSG
jgi:hypothetical protein